MTGPHHGASSVEERLEFETLIADISASLLAAEPHEIDEAVHDGVRRIREFFRADRCGLLKIETDRAVALLSYASFSEGTAPVSGDINLAELFPWAFRKLALERKPLAVTRMSDLPRDAAVDRASWEGMQTRSCVQLPIAIGDRVTHVIAINKLHEESEWPEPYLARLLLLGQMLVNAVERRQKYDDLQHALAEVQRLREQLQQENAYLRQEALQRRSSELIVGRSATIRRAVALAEQVAPTDSTVLLQGETGTGKERFASYIHESSRRRDRTMIRVNCAAIPHALIESELFGREKGAYTGAMSRQIGRFELAHGSTLFLDEIGDLPTEVQVKLLRAIEARTIERLGSPTPVPVDVRIIAATHRDLAQAVLDGTFRQDLYYRLNVFPISVPALRDRLDDIPILANTFAAEFAAAMGKRVYAIASDSLAALTAYPWPGNVRELRNVIERATILGTGPTLAVDVPSSVPAAPAVAVEKPTPPDRIDDVERSHIVGVLERTGWRIRGKKGAAEALGLKPTTLEYRMTKLGIRRPGRS